MASSEHVGGMEKGSTAAMEECIAVGSVSSNEHKKGPVTLLRWTAAYDSDFLQGIDHTYRCPLWDEGCKYQKGR